MLAREDTKEFYDTLRLILDKAHVPLDIKETLPKDHEASDDKFDLEKMDSLVGDFVNKEFEKRAVLRSCLYAFMGNLCLEKSLRLAFANDQSGILSQVVKDLSFDLEKSDFDMETMAYKQMAFLVNVSFETAG